MANARELKTRIKTVKNTAKITRTMEMVATAKSKKAFDRIHALKPYAEKLRELMGDLSRVGSVDHPLLRHPVETRHVTLVVVTANRGLCGGFNSNLLRPAKRRLEELRREGATVRLIAIGKKGAGFFRFNGLEPDRVISEFDEKVAYAQTEAVALELSRAFSAGETDRVEIWSNRLRGSASTEPNSFTLLPLEISDGEDATGGEIPYTFSPDPTEILGRLLPLAVNTAFFSAVIESMAGELIARRIAMKNATDAANEMKGDLTRVYNRSRQASITQEIAEIVGGVEALK